MGVGLVHLVLVLFGVLTTVNLIGVPLLALSLVAARGLGTVNRRLARVLLGAPITDPAPFRPGEGLFRRIGAALTDATGWRAVAHALLRLPAAVLAFAAAAGLWGGGLVLLASPLWRGWPGAALLSPAGLVLLLLAPWGLRLALAPERLLARTLLGMSANEARIRRLERARAFAADDAVARLRQVERDLHDGTSARLVTLAMTLGLAREELDLGHLERARPLVEGAHRDAKETMAELRDLIRGMLPPALDQGLETALATLAARTPMPVRLDADLPERPDPSIEAVAYFCAAELLANVVRHSGARHASVDVRGRDGRLTLVVRDDGAGGAVTGAGSGLRGLAARTGAVDGTVDVRSPAGGPTVITVALPLHI
ncbi:sensor histidine kinase [Herbidospora sp. NBRC 101105]|uniref:sensor histidine kinase n=1 Tax=Herbidospora sp. NBRC 101105 TaxID=3032195 RepID=UPI0024A01BE6|nr:sensor histidine kinase [Herbidospora sp. NBRC 101105]GLX97229.1 histidine kinase [Herbidospora sp. NBRC 101105]